MLVGIVVVCNLIITIFNLYLVWKIWQIRRCLSCSADILVDLEENLTLILPESPSLILELSREINRLNDQYKRIESKGKKLNFFLSILSLIYRIYQQKINR
jgi:hypothetical protein